MRTESLRAAALLLVATVSACSHAPMKTNAIDDGPVRITVHRDGDDLMTAGLGRAGLLAPTPPPVADAAAPTASELRRRAIYANWRGIAAIATSTYETLPAVPGREYATLVRTPGAREPHRVVVQVPDAFDRARRCLVVAPASGSRGAYGAISVAAPWALPKGCAIAYTDKAAGTAFYDFDTHSAATLDGTMAARADGPVEFMPTPGEPVPAHAVAVKHAHSQDNPEAAWGRHTIEAARFGLAALSDAFPHEQRYTAANTRIIAVGISNGGGAVLHAAELDDDGLFDAVVAGEPNILPPQGRPLYDLGSETALYQPCALLALPDAPALLPEPAWRAVADARCASLARAGLISGATPAARARDALAKLRAMGWEDAPLALSGVHLATDLWRAVLVTYLHSYARADAATALCGYSFALVDQAGAPRASTAAERALWWADASGIPPTAGVGIVDAEARAALQSGQADDPHFAGLECIRAAWTDADGELGSRIRASIDATRADARPKPRHVHIVHGTDDSLIPPAFTSRPYVAAVRANGLAIELTEVPRAQHFDAFTALPALAGRYVPLLPEIYRALDRAWAALE